MKKLAVVLLMVAAFVAACTKKQPATTPKNTGSQTENKPGDTSGSAATPNETKPSGPVDPCAGP